MVKHVSKLAADYFGGVAHVHTVLSNHPDHRESNLTVDRIVATLEQGKLAAVDEAPLEYIVLNEHPSDPNHPKILGRLSIRGRRLLRQRRRPVVGRVPIIYGLEVSILANGRTDLSPRLADRCPIVIASRHRLPSEIEHDPDEITQMFIDACFNDQVDVLGHPPRYIENQPDVDWERIFTAAFDTGTAIEINVNTYPKYDAFPDQVAFWIKWLDLLAESNAFVYIGTDIHNQIQLDAFVSQWHDLDEETDRQENHLAQFIIGLHDAHIDPNRVVTADLDRIRAWVDMTKAERVKALKYLT